MSSPTNFKIFKNLTIPQWLGLFDGIYLRIFYGWKLKQFLISISQVDGKDKEGGEKETSADKPETAEPEIKKESESADSAEAAKKSEEEPKAETPKDRVIKDGQLQVRTAPAFSRNLRCPRFKIVNFLILSFKTLTFVGLSVIILVKPIEQKKGNYF